MSREIVQKNNIPVKIDGITGSASFTHTATKGQGMTNSSGYEYEVFLSFRGEDTRTSFTDFLYISMIDAGIHVYKDDEELCKGENFGPELLRAINQSKISIPIFSKGYASSVWCLKELVQMVECQKTRGQKIMPIFYDVAPSEVRHQIRDYGEAFLTHENKKRYDKETMRKWKAALTMVGELDGWDLQKMANRKEGEMARTVTQKVFNELKKAYLVVSNNLVGVDNHVDKIMKEIGAHINQTRIIGIHGMGGIGKTTIAKIIYNELSNKYNNCCFLSNIHETSKLRGIEYLQQQLIFDILKMKGTDIRNIDEGIKTIKERLPNKKVLLLLDDVEEKDHMDALVGKRDWFGEGSKLIVTTRRKDVLCVPEVDWRYELTCLDPNLSLQLFSKHAFRRESPVDDYIGQSKRAIRIVGGLPLAIEVIGSLLSCKNKEMWDATLNLLESVPHDKVQNKLKISYDALDYRQKHIFLDIACYFIGCCKDIVCYFWDASKLFPEATLEVLQNMSLIKIEENNILWMHDQLRDLGREIVRQESEMNIEKQRWVWNPEDGLKLLRIHEEKKEVEALHLEFDDHHRFTYEDFKRLPNLTFLEVDDLKENFCGEKMLLSLKGPSYALPTNISQRNTDLLPRLRWLSWHNIRPTCMIVNFFVENLILLDLSWCEITHDWKGWSHMKVCKNLKFLNLAHCRRLKRTPNFSTHSNLEHLILSCCNSLIKIDRSICQLKRLVFLDVSYCRNLQRLPDELGRDLASLEYLSLSGCSSLERLPETIGNLESLIELNISSTGIKELPNSIEKLKNLKIVNMEYDISKIHDAFLMKEKFEVNYDVFSMMEKFEVNYLKKNFRAKRKLFWPKGPSYALPTNIFQRNLDLLPRLLWLSWHNIRPTFKIVNFSVENLIVLDLSWSKITHDWKGWSHMKVIKNLKALNLAHCQCLRRTPNFSAHSNLERLILLGCKSLIEIDGSICQLKCLLFLDVSYCWRLQRLPDELGRDLASLKYLSLRSCLRLKRLPETIGNLESLIELNISSTIIKELPDSIEKLKNLKIVNMQDSGISKIHDAFWMMKKLEKIEILLKDHPNKCLHVEIGDCIYENKSLRILRLRWVRIHALPRLSESLIELELRDLRVDAFPDLSNLANLKELHLGFRPPNCDGKSDGLLEELIPRWIGNLSKLESLELLFYKENASSTDLSLPPHPRRLPRLPSNLSSLNLHGFHSLCSMDLSNLRKLSSLKILHSVVAEIEGLGWLENLQDLNLNCVGQLAMLPDLSKLNKLRRILVLQCGNLIKIQGELPRFLDELKIYYCDSLQEFPNLFNLMGKTNVYVHIRNQVFKYTGGSSLLFCGFKQMQIPDLSNWNRLIILSVESCHNLVEIQGELPQSLEYLDIESCESLQKLPDLSSLKGLQEVRIRCCGKLTVEEISRLCSEKSVKFVEEEDEEDKLPVWARIQRYEKGRWVR